MTYPEARLIRKSRASFPFWLVIDHTSFVQVGFNDEYKPA